MWTGEGGEGENGRGGEKARTDRTDTGGLLQKQHSMGQSRETEELEKIGALWPSGLQTTATLLEHYEFSGHQQYLNKY